MRKSVRIGLYKNSGSVSCVAVNFLSIRLLYMLRTQLLHKRSQPGCRYAQIRGLIGLGHGQL